MNSKETSRQAGRLSDRLSDRQTDRQTDRHFQVQSLEKGVSENEAPGPVGAYTTTHNDT